MSRRDLFHDAVRHALEKAGWAITHDPYPVFLGLRKLRIDLGAEAPLGAEKEGRKIAVEVKNFVGLSEVSELEKAIGQYMLYDLLIEKQDKERQLFLAIPDDTFSGLFSEEECVELRKRCDLKLLVYSAQREEITQWIETNTPN